MNYKNPLKKKLENLRDKAFPRMKKIIDDTIPFINDIDPKNVRDKLPKEVKKFFMFTAIRSHFLTNQLKHAKESKCYIEVLILVHGYIQFTLRALYILSWQAASTRSLTKEEIEPFYLEKSKKGSVIWLGKILGESKIIHPEQVASIGKVNDIRNKAAHGVIFGEIEINELANHVELSINTANQIFLKLKAWFNNPLPLKKIL